jgi:DNA repair exonuclease SbcCD ATPase subunit
MASIKDFSDKIAMCKYISYMCSDDGLKSYVIKMFVPFFNQAIESNLRRFNLPYTITFDKSMDYKFESIYGAAPCYDMLSQGQKRKVNFAIAMAFCDFVFRVANFEINVLFLDEILDVSTDDVALREMVMLVRTRAEKTPTIFAVTHRESIIRDLFDYKMNIDNNGLFSTIGSCTKLK